MAGVLARERLEADGKMVELRSGPSGGEEEEEEEGALTERIGDVERPADGGGRIGDVE
ncbi:MAG: hypothetical protein Q9209_003711 [Squamulea sp. 1 TL-2023]